MSDGDYALTKVQEAFKAAFDIDPDIVQSEHALQSK